MCKRILSVLLCVTMLLSYGAPLVQAQETDIVANSAGSAGNGTSYENGAIYVDEGSNVTLGDNVVYGDLGSEPQYSGAAPECDCGYNVTAIDSHADSCVLKDYYVNLCDHSAEMLYRIWANLPEEARVFIRAYLDGKDHSKLDALEALIKENAPPTGEASAIVDGGIVDAYGIPEGGDMTVTEITADDTLAENLEKQEGVKLDGQLFSWDISVQDAKGADWQPEEPVQLELKLDGVKLHKHAVVYVAHISDDGEVDYIRATVREDGTVAFNTTGFSTFVGFTVDFEYEGVQFSIGGLESILLSQLMDQLKMPLDIGDVADVSFTDDSLISLTKQGNDWLLTSLKAFDTEEKLTLTLTNGEVIPVKVTDATSAKLYMHDDDVGDRIQICNGNGADNWTITEYNTSGDGSFKFPSQWGTVWSDGTNDPEINFEDRVCEIRGPGNYDIALQMPSASVFKGDTLYVDLKSIQITGGADVTIRLGADVNTNIKYIIFRAQTTDDPLFRIDNGSLTIANTENYTTHSSFKFVLDGNDNGHPIINCRDNTTGLTLNKVLFQHGNEGGIRVRTAVQTSTISLTNCNFADTVRRAEYGYGGAIYIFQNVKDKTETTTGGYVQVGNLTLTNCYFDKNYAEDGGAIAIRGKVHNATISGCTFNQNQATHTVNQATGGAIYVSGSMGTFQILNSQFLQCKSDRHGGAIRVESVIHEDVGTLMYSRIYTMTVSGCTFNGCETTNYHGSAMSIQTEMTKLSILSCTFEDCKTNGNGSGTVTIQAKELPDTWGSGDGMSNWTSAMDDTVHGTRPTETYVYDDTRYTTIQTVEIKGASDTNRSCKLLNCSSANHAGGLCFLDICRIRSVTIEYVTIDGCSAMKEGSAILFQSCYLSKVDLKNSTIQNCTFAKDANGNYLDPGDGTAYGAGTIRTNGEAALFLEMYNCTVKNNYSPTNGGGLYWNANGIKKLLSGDECKAIVTSCTFEGNHAGHTTAYGLGGGIFVEGVIDIVKCTITNNTANEGGGVMQNIYNNSGREIISGEKTILTLDPETKIYGNTATRGGGVAIRAKASMSIPNDKVVDYTMQFTLGGAYIYNNYATTNGGGICFITNSYTAGSADQAEVDRISKIILINDGYIYGNTAGYGDGNTGNGGGVYMESSHNTSLTISNGNIYGNTASGGNGGGVYMTGANAVCTITGGTIGNEEFPNEAAPIETVTDGVTTYTKGNGGGICVIGASRIEMTGGVIQYNKAYVGGGIAVRDGAAMISQADGNNYGQILHNTATTAGGGIAIHSNSAMVISDGVVSDNLSAYGGGISIMDSTGIDYPDDSNWEDILYGMVFDGGEISGNYAAHILTSEEAAELTNGIDTTNQTYGGGIVLSSASTMSITGGIITGNKAVERVVNTDKTYTDSYTEGEEGGGVAVCQGSSMTLIGGLISENSAYNGGGFCVRGSSSVTISGNVAFNDDESVNVEDSEGVILSNTASNMGGGIYLWNGSTMNLTGGLIDSNEGYDGGGIAISRKSELTLEPEKRDGTAKGAYLTNNHADRDGGAVYIAPAFDDNGDAASEYACTFTITGGTISNNTADNDGGGIKSMYCGKVNINGGTLSNNTAEHTGGGVYAYHYTTLTISGGTISGNKANAEYDSSNIAGGGGVAVSTYSICYIKEGCTISGNSAPNAFGGGVFCFRNDQVQITGGTIEGNSATRGAAIAVLIQNGSKPDLELNGGTITGNEASVAGGGIYVASGAQVQVKGGSVSLNTANNGGGVYLSGSRTSGSTVYKSTIEMEGGAITQNTATNAGGGVFLQSTAVGVIKQSTTANADGTFPHGEISENTAARGGGVLVQTGGSLTVDNGYVINNHAIIPAGKKNSTTAYHKTPYGVGGGVCVLNTAADKAVATFTLTGTTGMAIYGNTAEFAADDVFANGIQTQVNLPEVSGMNLSGYGFPAVGWVEDYPYMDSAYTSGLNQAVGNQGITNGKNVYRYRSGNTAYVVFVDDSKVTDLINAAPVEGYSPYICLTLGIPSANKDVVVVDYGIPVAIDILYNDFGLQDGGALIKVASLRKDPAPGQVDFTKGALDSVWKNTSNGLKFGSVSGIKENDVYKKIRYTPNILNMTSSEQFSYAINCTFGEEVYYFYSSVAIIPATTIYYEDTEMKADGTTPLINYTTYNVVKNSDGTFTDQLIEGGTWKKLGTTKTYMQSTDRIGMDGIYSVGNMTGNYGYDGNYADKNTYSYGSSMRFTATPETSAKATFTFKGTGFDLISLCNIDTGSAVVTVTNSKDASTTYFVDTYYGQKFSNGAYTPGKNQGWLYQVPVLKVDMGQYDTYSVEIYVAYNEWFDHFENPDKEANSYDFYLDAIRIYNPAGDGVVYNSDGSVKDTTIRDAYLADGEYNPTFHELRDLFINPNNNASYQSGQTVNGTLFIDGGRSLDGSQTANVEEYLHYGPNNEVYIPQNKYVAFRLNKTANMSRVQIAFKCSRYDATADVSSVRIYGLDEDNNAVNPRTITLNSMTELYHDITDLNGYAVVIKNTSTKAYHISITTIKTTHTLTATKGGATADYNDLDAFTVDMETAERVAAHIKSESVEAPTLTLDHPTIAFEDEIFYNLYFNVSDMTNVKEMGLITFDSRLTDGTMEHAVDIIPGAVEANGLYMANTNGIPAKNMGDTVYFKVYALLTDGTYVYSDVAGYNAVAYANTVLAGSNEAAKTLVVAMLNYGAAAQVQFGYNTDNLMNAGLTADQKALVSDFAESMVNDPLEVDNVKGANFTKTGSFSDIYPKVSFEGSFAINYYAAPSGSVDGNVTLYYWNQAAVEGAEVLSVDNASGSLTMTAEGELYTAAVSDIAAKQIDETFVVAIVYESNGETCCSGLISYSLGAYCLSLANNSDAAVQGLARATATYGYYAKAFFAN